MDSKKTPSKLGAVDPNSYAKLLEKALSYTSDPVEVTTQASEDFYSSGTTDLLSLHKLIAEVQGRYTPEALLWQDSEHRIRKILPPFYCHKKEIKVERTIEPPYIVGREYYASAVTFERTLPTGLPTKEEVYKDWIQVYQESLYSFLSDGLLEGILTEPKASAVLFKESLSSLVRDVIDLSKGSIGSLDLIVIDDTRSVQYRFPRSRRARIRKKWRKDRRNWRRVSNGYNGPYELISPLTGRKQILCSRKHYLELQARLGGTK